MKKLWKQNRVLLMLIIILIICFIAIICVASTFFYNKDVTEYGNRLDGIEDYEITDKFQEEYENKLLENEHLESVKINIKGRIIYVNLDFDSEIGLEDAKTMATTSLENFSEEYLEYYDVCFVMVSDNFTILGTKNAVSKNVAWNNNTPVEEEEETDEE